MVFLSQAEVCLGRVLRPLVTVEGKSTSDLFLYEGLADGVGNQRRRQSEPIFHARTAFLHKSSTAHMYSMHPQLHDLVVPLLCMVPVHGSAHLIPCQSQTFPDLAIRFSCL